MEDTNDIPFNRYNIDFFGAIGNMFTDSSASIGSYVSTLFEWLVILWSATALMAFVASAILLYGIIYTYIRANQLGAAQNAFIQDAEQAYRALYGRETKHWRWNDVQEHIDSDRPNDWKLAIIEADVLLKETLDAAGFAGATIADQLKGASPHSFRTLDAAWRAHKVRNQVAHSGTDFVLTKRLAQETITQYKMVFDEFGVI